MQSMTGGLINFNRDSNTPNWKKERNSDKLLSSTSRESLAKKKRKNETLNEDEERRLEFKKKRKNEKYDSFSYEKSER